MEQALESLGLEAARSNKPGMTIYLKPGFKVYRWNKLYCNVIFFNETIVHSFIRMSERNGRAVVRQSWASIN